MSGSGSVDDASARKWQEIEERRQREQQNYSRSQKATGSEATNPKCFMDVSMGQNPLGRIYFELFGDTVPLTVENFRSLITGECGFDAETAIRLDLIDCCFHRVVPSSQKNGGYIVGGDIVHGTGTGGLSIFGQPFIDESFRLRHNQPGLLSMVSRGPNMNTSQFCITTVKCPFLDYRQVVFGRVTDGLSIVEKIELAPVDRNCVPREKVRITFCGQQNKTQPNRPPLEPSPVSPYALQPRRGGPPPDPEQAAPAL
eukprot:TRINITY_DN32081_c0_g1_i1.p1 TRINITY_DN32081_c0_g1~~TRINITY_DN32081_c0_g1_i1.p1  ORF type:complete len:283 (+),score=106.54 TRINITY_DN32081_c0_g1_i1:83-850(+)